MSERPEHTPDMPDDCPEEFKHYFLNMAADGEDPYRPPHPRIGYMTGKLESSVFSDMTAKICGVDEGDAHMQLVLATTKYLEHIPLYAQDCKDDGLIGLAPMLAATLTSLEILSANMRATLPPGDEASEAFFDVWYELGQFMMDYASRMEEHALFLKYLGERQA